MKLIASLFFILLSHKNIASPIPTDPCKGLRKDCTEWMIKLHDDFLQAHDLQSRPGAYVGSCYYHANDYSNNHRHYAALLIDQDQEGQLYFNGAFSFFAPADRYKDWNLQTARDRISNPFKFPLTSYGNHSMADYSPKEGLWKFWLSQNPENDEIYLISYWGFFQRGFCRFNLVD